MTLPSFRPIVGDNSHIAFCIWVLLISLAQSVFPSQDSVSPDLCLALPASKPFPDLLSYLQCSEAPISHWYCHCQSPQLLGRASALLFIRPVQTGSMFFPVRLFLPVFLDTSCASTASLSAISLPSVCRIPGHLISCGPLLMGSTTMISLFLRRTLLGLTSTSLSGHYTTCCDDFTRQPLGGFFFVEIPEGGIYFM